jgi:DNA processing protein
MISKSDRDTIIWLSSLNIGNRNIEKIMYQLDNLQDLWDMPPNEIYKLNDINSSVLEKIISYRDENYLNRLYETIYSNNINVITIFDEDYPEDLKYIHDKPLVLYIKGNITKEDNVALAVVGSRKHTSYGKWATEYFVRELVKLDVTIVSGLALGIDSIAHKTALEYGGRTIAVLGNGLDVIYPKKNRELYNRIPENGALMTEFTFGVQPLSHNFPNRNRIISGISLGVIVIEAKEKSGSLITAEHALEQGKEVFALPGNINSIFSKGTNKLIKEGAKLVMDIDDIIEEIYLLKNRQYKSKEKEIDFSNLSDLEIKIVEAIKEGPTHCDLIAIKTGLDISTVNSVITILEIKGIVKEISGRVFSL